MQKNMSSTQKDVPYKAAKLAQWLSVVAPTASTLTSLDRRRSPRIRVVKRLLSICDSCAGPILEISRTGLSFEFIHFSKTVDKNSQQPARPHQSGCFDILSPGFDGYLLRNVPIQSVFDLKIGRRFPDNNGIIVFRRGVRFTEPLTEPQLSRLWRYFDVKPFTEESQQA